MLRKEVNIVENEIWKDIPNYEGIYQVSNMGRVRSLTRIVYHGDIKYCRKGVIRKPFNTKDYDSLMLSKDGTKKIYMVHRLVALTFLPNPNNKPEVNHKDGNKRNNKLENLEWVTTSENKLHAIRTGLLPIDQIRENGRKSTDVVATRILCVDTGEVFESAVSITKYLKMQFCCVDDFIDDVLITHKGKGWTLKIIDEAYYQAHKNDVVDKVKCAQVHESIRNRIGLRGVKLPIYCVEQDKTYKSMVEAAKANNMDWTTISLAIRENRKAKGLTFIRIQDRSW